MIKQYNPGACLALDDVTRGTCQAEHRSYYTQGCPTKFGIYAILVMALYIISYAPGMGTVPWVVNSEIYPLRHRGFCSGTAAVANWTSNLIVSQTFLTLNTDIGDSRNISPICRVRSQFWDLSRYTFWCLKQKDYNSRRLRRYGWKGLVSVYVATKTTTRILNLMFSLSSHHEHLFYVCFWFHLLDVIQLIFVRVV